jgi:hypothetical protein
LQRAIAKYDRRRRLLCGSHGTLQYLPPLSFLAALALATPARAELGSLRLALEPSMAEIQTPSRPISFGYGGGGSVEVGLGDALGATIFGNWQAFPNRGPELATSAMGATLLYRLDDWRVTPYIELGFARVTVTPNRGIPPPAELIPTLGLGFEVIQYDWLLWGAVMRYYPLFATDLLSAPAFATLHARIGVAFDWGE